MWLLGWACVFLTTVSAQPEITLYKKVGDEVVLQPGAATVTGTITSILWKDGRNLAVQWDGVELDLYRHFKERGSLNVSNGALTITGLTRNDSNLYTPEINGVAASPIKLTIISPVPTPTVIKSCDEENSTCTLTCDGNTTEAEPVTYKWMSDGKLSTGSSKERRITKEDSSSVFSCELENPVSHKSSPPIPNPFITTPESTSSWNPRISTGITVLVSLLTAVLLLILVHRWKAGNWFFQKDSMPWEAGFWSRNEPRPPRDVGEANGNNAYRKRDSANEETSLT